MCLITEQKKPKIAENDMIVYKVLKASLYTPYQSFRYELGELYETTIKNSTEWTAFDLKDAEWLNDHYPKWKDGDFCAITELKCIGQGFHSTLEPERLFNVAHYEGEIYECTIPKGSEYYVNATGMCVSNQIIVNRQMDFRDAIMHARAQMFH